MSKLYAPKAARSTLSNMIAECRGIIIHKIDPDLKAEIGDIAERLKKLLNEREPQRRL